MRQHLGRKDILFPQVTEDSLFIFCEYFVFTYKSMILSASKEREKSKVRVRACVHVCINIRKVPAFPEMGVAVALSSGSEEGSRKLELALDGLLSPCASSSPGPVSKACLLCLLLFRSSFPKNASWKTSGNTNANENSEQTFLSILRSNQSELIISVKHGGGSTALWGTGFSRSP